jgi:hypothetical protein
MRRPVHACPAAPTAPPMRYARAANFCLGPGGATG